MLTNRARTVPATTMLLVVFVSLLRLAWEINTPTNLLSFAMHDDAHFIRLAQHIAKGEWLGPFSQYTLMKGPGYPVFLALGTASGLPVSALHALFAVTSILVTSWAVLRITGSRAAALAVFLLLALLPLPSSFQPGFNRVTRDQIYWGQTLIFFSTFSVILFAPLDQRWKRHGLAVVCGCVLGWAWLTREEGVWFAPAIVILLVGKALQSWLEKRSMGDAAAGSAIVASGFAAVLIAFMTTNLFVYDRFADVDFKERNFQSALAGLQNVVDDARVPYVPVSDETLRLVAEVSPAFSPLAASFRPGGPLENWRNTGCRRYPETCGKIIGAHFVWALRDAGALNGFYSSPAAASRKFGQVADDIRQACDNGQLRCRFTLSDSIPPMSMEQWLSVPGTIGSAIALISRARSTAFTEAWGAATTHQEFGRFWQFLNYPRILPPGPDVSAVSGWFYDKTSSDWPALRVKSGDAGEATVLANRVDSPDIAKFFGDTNATLNRFRITHRCTTNCTLVAAFPDGSEMRLGLSSGSVSLSENQRRLYVDSNDPESQTSRQDPRSLVALRFSKAMVDIYRILYPATLLLGLACWGARLALDLRKRRISTLLIIATAAWVLVLARATLIALVEVSSFDALSMVYLAPALPLAGLAAIVSISAMVSRDGAIAVRTPR
ncbi:hypothetical protein [Mesorhizobium sp. KR9-304]|uniref:hypothetical protein n=1 Tax=Mesorhizobium sp. KR9-304 TaxID=3156614 RepID=UPI0032B470B9